MFHKLDCSASVDESPNSQRFSDLKIAIIHDWLVTDAGSEQVLRSILGLFPNAEIFTLVDFLSGQGVPYLKGRKINTSFIQKLPKAATKYRSYLPLMPMAIEQFDLSGFDLVISSSHAVAKGVLTGPNQVHVCYCHSPIRYAWDLQHQYLREARMRGLSGIIARTILHYIRIWDYRTAAGVDLFIANSDFIRRRIRKVYGRDSLVIHPPAAIEDFPLREDKEDVYLAVSRMVPYKKVPLIAEAFAGMPGRRLIIAGTGPDMPRVQAAAAGAGNIEVVGYQSQAALRDLMQRAKAFVFVAEEDFGIVNVEVQACGTPVIAYGQGGALEVVRGAEHGPGRTGLFFQEQTVEGIRHAVEQFESLAVAPSAAACRANAERFSESLFRERFLEAVRQALDGGEKIQ